MISDPVPRAMPGTGFSLFNSTEKGYDLQKFILFLFAISILFLIIFSCDSSEKQPGDKITITFWHSFVSSTIPALNELLAMFEKEHPEITIRAQYIPTGDALIQKLITAVQSKTAPDISWLHSDFMQDLVEADAIYKMEDFISGPDSVRREDLNDIYPALIRYASWRGVLYSLPMEATNLALIYNKEMFRQAGLNPEQPPRTWEELHEYAKKLTFDKDGDGKFEQVGLFLPIFPAAGPLSSWMVWQWLPYLWQADGEIINEEQTRVIFNEEAGVQALTLWQNIFNDIKLSTFTTDYDVAFASRHLAMSMDGPWNLPRFEKMMQNLDWGFAPLPAGPKKSATVVGGEYLAIFKQSKHPAEAWKFLKWIIRPEIQAFWSMKSGYLPIRHAVSKIPEFQEYLNSHPNFKVFVQQMEVGQAQRPIDFYGIEITRYVAEAIEKATIGKIDPKTALDEAAVKANKLLSSVAERND